HLPGPPHDDARLEVPEEEVAPVGPSGEVPAALGVPLAPRRPPRAAGDLEGMRLQLVPVPERRLPIERSPGLSSGGIGAGPAEPLKAGEVRDEPAIHGQHTRREFTSLALARRRQCIEERGVTEVLLQVDSGLLVDLVDLRDRQTGVAKRPRVGEEGTVLLRIRAVYTDGGLVIPAHQAVELARGTIPVEGEDRCGRFTEVAEEQT